MQKNYLAKWLNNELSDEELSVFENSEEFASYQQIIAASDQLKAPDFDVDEALAALKNKRILEEPKVIQLNPFKKFMRVAAAVVILMAGSYFYLNSFDKNISTQYAETTEIRLPDTSQVILNADSELSYSERKWESERKVTLKGEAFFKVAKGKRFTVSTHSGTVTVLGTQFNVENREEFFEVTCFEGLVSVLFNGKETKLPAGKSFLAVNREIKESEITSTLAPSWINKESSFKSIPLKYVLNEFQRQHNIVVKTKNININQLYTGSFSNTNIDLALQSISVPSQIKFKLEGDQVLFYAKNPE